MGKLTIIKKEVPQILLKDSAKRLPLVIDVVNFEVLAVGVSLIAKQAFRMAGTEMLEEDIVCLMDDILAEKTHDPIEDIIIAIVNIRKGKYKVYGKVTSDLFRQAVQDCINKRIDERDRLLANQKDEWK